MALKLLSPGLADDEAFRARFIRESRLAASIDDPNIVPVYEAGEIEGVFYLAMRYVEGTDLESHLRQGPLTPEATVHVVSQIARALDAAHERGLVHRDVKPANVLIVSGKGPDRPDHAYLTDFGLTKHRGSETGVTRAGSFMGTLDYIAPEQLEAKPVDGRADEYALACVAFQCLTGAVPFERDSDPAILMAHLRDAPPSAAAADPRLPDALDAVIARGMAKKPDDRYPSCVAFATALRQALGVRPTEERQLPLRPGRRWPWVVAGVGLVAVLAGGAMLLGGGWPSGASSGAPSGSAPGLATEVPSSSAFPDAGEQALIARLPPAMRESCERGSYESAQGYEGQSGRGVAAPESSIACDLPVDSGASRLYLKAYSGYSGNYVFTVAGRIGVIALSVNAGQSDCATARRALQRWSAGGDEQGAMLCYQASGTSWLYWSYDDARVLASASRDGTDSTDSTALYDWWNTDARFIEAAP